MHTCTCRTIGAGLLYTSDCPLAAHRALSIVGTGRYQAGAGGLDPSARTPYANGAPNGEADCSGFAAWAARLSRSLKMNAARSSNPDARRFWRDVTMGGYGYLSTDSVWKDARGSQLVVQLVKTGDEVLPGDFVVYPGVFRKIERKGQSPAYKRIKMGHMGVVTEVRPIIDGGTVRPWRYTTTRDLGWLRIVHMNAGRPPACDESNGDIWAKNSRSIVARVRDDLPR